MRALPDEAGQKNKKIFISIFSLYKTTILKEIVRMLQI